MPPTEKIIFYYDRIKGKQKLPSHSDFLSKNADRCSKPILNHH